MSWQKVMWIFRERSLLTTKKKVTKKTLFALSLNYFDYLRKVTFNRYFKCFLSNLWCIMVWTSFPINIQNCLLNKLLPFIFYIRMKTNLESIRNWTDTMSSRRYLKQNETIDKYFFKILILVPKFLFLVLPKP